MGKAGKFFYAVKQGRQPGIYETWADAEAQVKGFSKPMFKKFHTAQEAQNWINIPGDSTTNNYAVPSSIPDLSTPVTVPVPVVRASGIPAPLSTNSPASSSSVYKGANINASDISEAEEIIAYTDGASKNNQDKATRVAGYGVHWAAGRPASVPGDISEPCPGVEQTNNYGELMAIIRVLELTKEDPRPLTIYSDSIYSISCFDWHQQWSINNWKNSKGATPANLNMIRYMVSLRGLREMRRQKTAIMHVKGHASSSGNNCADWLANQGAFKPHSAELVEPDWEMLRRKVEAEQRATFSRPAAAPTTSSSATPATSPVTSSTAPTGSAVKVVDLTEFDIAAFDASDILDGADLAAELSD